MRSYFCGSKTMLVLLSKVFIAKTKLWTNTLTKITKKEYKLHFKLWINNDIKNVMFKKDRLYRKCCSCKDSYDKNVIHEQGKTLRNQVSYEICKSENEYKWFFEKNISNISKI